MFPVQSLVSSSHSTIATQQQEQYNDESEDNGDMGFGLFDDYDDGYSRDIEQLVLSSPGTIAAQQQEQLELEQGSKFIARLNDMTYDMSYKIEAQNLKPPINDEPTHAKIVDEKGRLNYEIRPFSYNDRLQSSIPAPPPVPSFMQQVAAISDYFQTSTSVTSAQSFSAPSFLSVSSKFSVPTSIPSEAQMDSDTIKKYKKEMLEMENVALPLANNDRETAAVQSTSISKTLNLFEGTSDTAASTLLSSKRKSACYDSDSNYQGKQMSSTSARFTDVDDFLLDYFEKASLLLLLLDKTRCPIIIMGQPLIYTVEFS
ncbi:unnamed protein product [Didymodactylos carnosus]|uniref:Uncharacterized protein n=1 Tax=Didymodactylos carnosus TaxID=1234261 RepID=A0A814VH06_9BILA|nr:unnamed protein product [Didymodactylos carnosus]CAF1190640.1 unnamed protein product [Didymodactylos carnosus]CAF3748349.1 unnamed protein product [Didymodactylos carnosus]CAF3954848.1 unnamed protein product [Didymodactylos carnosus]